MSSYFNLKGFDNVFENTLNNEIQDNIVEFFDWALLEKGNYQNVTKGELAPNGYDYSKLTPSSSTNFPTGLAWEGFRKNWVWQSGVSYNPPPIVGNNDAIPGISGVYVNDIFYPSDTSGDYSHKVDYFHGRVIFDNPIPTGSLVQAEYSYKYINVIYAHSLPWLREVQYRSLDFDTNKKLDILPESTVQLPAIAIEIVPRRTLKGYQLGGGQWVNTDILFHCLAEDEFTRNKLVDIVSLQNDKNVAIFDSNIVAQSGKFPIDYMGVPVSGAMRYPDLIRTFYKDKVFLKNSIVQGMEIINSNFYAGIVRMTVESIQQTI